MTSLSLRINRGLSVLVRSNDPLLDFDISTLAFCIEQTQEVEQSYCSSSNLLVVQSGTDDNGPFLRISVDSSMQALAPPATRKNSATPPIWNESSPSTLSAALPSKLASQPETSPYGSPVPSSCFLFDHSALDLCSPVKYGDVNLDNLFLPDMNLFSNVSQGLFAPSTMDITMSNEMESVNITDSSLSSRPENGQETPSHDGIHSQADFPTPSTSSNADTVASPSPSEETQSSQKTKDDANRQYACSHPNCNRRFIREYTRRVHELTHAPKARSPFICSFPNCNGRFSRQHDRLRHEVVRHGKESAWTCSLCGRYFSSKKTLDRHTCADNGSISRIR